MLLVIGDSAGRTFARHGGFRVGHTVEESSSSVPHNQHPAAPIALAKSVARAAASSLLGFGINWHELQLPKVTQPPPTSGRKAAS